MYNEAFFTREQVTNMIIMLYIEYEFLCVTDLSSLK